MVEPRVGTIHRPIDERCGELLRDEFAQAVGDPAEIDEELGCLFAAPA